MEIKQLVYFKAIMEERTISGAARKLHISQPPLSVQMKLLEKELGVSLFERGSRRIRPTEAGRVLYRYAREILELSQVAREEIGDLKAGQAGHVRLGLVSSSASPFVYEVLRHFMETYPAVGMKVYEGNTYELLEDLQKGNIEISLMRTPFPTEGLELIDLETDPMVAAGQSCFLPKGEEALPLKALEGRPLLIYRRWEAMISRAFEKEMALPHIFTTADDARTVVQWAQAGLGVALVPRSVMIWGHHLVIRELASSMLTSRLVAAKKKDAPISQSALALFEEFREESKRA